MKEKGRVFLYGINTVNLGDDLFFKIIFDRYPNTEFVFIAPDIYKIIFQKYNNCKIIPPAGKFNIPLIGGVITKFFNIINLLRILIQYRIRVFLIVGGSIFMEGNSNIPNVVNKLRKAKICFHKLGLCILGSNFGPYTSRGWIETVKESIKYVDDVCFRDSMSYNLFAELPNVRMANDIVMHTKIDHDIEKDKSICVNLRSTSKWPHLSSLHKEYLSTTKNLIDFYISHGYKVKFISFCSHYGDEEIMDELYSMFDCKENIDRIYYRGDIEETIHALSTCETIIATRFHAVVLGLVYGLKVMPISYSTKTENMLKSLGIWSEIYDYAKYCQSAIPDIISNAISNYVIDRNKNKQFEYLDKLLK